MSTIYFQYTEGEIEMSPEEIKQQNIKKYIQKIKENKIMIPIHVNIPISDNKIKKRTFLEYLETLDEIPELKPKESVSNPKSVAKLNKDYIYTVKDYYKEKFEEMLKTNSNETYESFKRDMAKIRGYVLKNNRYKIAKEKNKTILEYIENIEKHPLQNPITISLYIIKKDEGYKLVDGKDQEVTIDSKNQKISVEYTYDQDLLKIINSLHTLKINLPEEPAEITLETTELNDEKFKNTLNDKKKIDDDDEYDILYEYFYKNPKFMWSLKPSELYTDIRPK